MPTTDNVQKQNRELALTIQEEAVRDPQSQYAGKFVGLANGRVVVIADDLDEAARKLRDAEPEAEKCFCFQAGLDYDHVQEIWSLN